MNFWPSIGKINWFWVVIGVVVLTLLPLVIDTYTPNLLIIWAIFSLSLGLMWGFGGILSFGHSAYFGLGAYTYAVTAINFDSSTPAVFLAILVPAAFALIIGAMMFYGKISDVYLGVITLVITLVFFKFMNATAGDEYIIGNARLGGFNGIPGFPLLSVPGFPEIDLWGLPTYYISSIILVISYLIAWWILSSTFGKILVGIKDNEHRCSLMGYNVPAIKTGIFVISCSMAGVSGMLFANWAEIITPSVFTLGVAAEVIIWVIVGGVGTLIGPIIGAFILGYLKLLLGEQTSIDNSLIMGIILVLSVLIFPKGIANLILIRYNKFSTKNHNIHARVKRKLS